MLSTPPKKNCVLLVCRLVLQKIYFIIITILNFIDAEFVEIFTLLHNILDFATAHNI